MTRAICRLTVAATMGVAHCAAGSAYDTPLILAARQDALRAESGTDAGQSLP